MMTGACVASHHNIPPKKIKQNIYVRISILTLRKNSIQQTGACVRLISAGGAHSAAVVEASTGEEKGQEDGEGLKAMYGASPTLSPGENNLCVCFLCSYE
jgi:hypothetical protein